MDNLIIGYGEVGQALHHVLAGRVERICVYDNKGEWSGRVHPSEPEGVNILHICFPYSKKFIKEVKRYQKLFKPKYTIIHSSVPIGTSRQCQAIHSPIIGQHPNLEVGIKTFVKFIGGKQASEVADHFRRAGLRVMLFDTPEVTEAGKLYSTEYFKKCIEFCQRVKQDCEKRGLNFHEVYTLPNINYNEGYTKLDHPEFIRPILQPIMTPIGGHCVLQNSKLLNL